MIAGASAGAVNGSLLAARGTRFGEATAELARDFVLGSLTGHTHTHGLLDTQPLAALLERSLPPRGIDDAIRRGRLHAVAVTATSYHSGRSFTFVEGRPGHAIWQKSRRLVLPVTLTRRHVLASCAIPIVFPPVRVASQAGDLWFGDGGLRLVTPLSPAIRLGVSHILSIGVRSSRAAESLAREEVGAARTAAGASEPIRSVKPVAIAPSDDLALVAQRFAHRMPRVVRYLLEGLGTPDAQSADLMSYLLFDAAYTRTLVEIGYADAGRRSGEIEALIHEAPPPADASAGWRARRPQGLERVATQVP